MHPTYEDKPNGLRNVRCAYPVGYFFVIRYQIIGSHARAALGGRARRAGRLKVVRINNAREAIPFLRELASRTRRAMSPAAREATALLVGNWLRQPRIARGASNAGKKKKNARRIPENTAGVMSVNPHNVAEFVVPHPDLGGYALSIANAEIAKVRPEILARLPIRENFTGRFVVPPVGGRGVNVAHGFTPHIDGT